MSSMRVLAAAVPLLFAAPLVAAPQSTAPSTTPSGTAADGSQTVMAVWVEKSVGFPYQGLTTFYSCDGIEYEVALILEAIGVRAGYEVSVRSCIRDTHAGSS